MLERASKLKPFVDKIPSRHQPGIWHCTRTMHVLAPSRTTNQAFPEPGHWWQSLSGSSARFQPPVDVLNKLSCDQMYQNRKIASRFQKHSQGQKNGNCKQVIRSEINICLQGLYMWSLAPALSCNFSSRATSACLPAAAGLTTFPLSAM